MRSQTISGSTRLVALLGDPVAHSISPAIHNHAMACLGLPYAYVALPTPSPSLSTVVTTLRACDFLGANVTIPHKQSVLALCDRVSELSRKIGAVNTLYFQDQLLCGTSTDTHGFFKSLDSIGFDPMEQDIVILGNGGTARTLAFGLMLEKKPRAVTLVGRDARKVAHLACEVSDGTSGEIGFATFGSSEARDAISAAGLLINCTSVGMAPNHDQTPVDCSLLNPDTVVFDAVYNPLETRLLREARELGCQTQNGLRMLLFQGLASFELWTGTEVPESIFDMKELAALISAPSPHS